jgi:hypothetical protein
MSRVHLLEIEDQPWCPAPIRDGGTDFLEFTQKVANPFAPIAPKLAEAMKATGTSTVIDLCSGGAGPWEGLSKSLKAEGMEVEVQLTDLHPNEDAFERIERNSEGRIRGVREPVDATNVPSKVRGFRTLFNAFHHFRPDMARSILADAVHRGEGIGIFEGVERTPLAIASIPFMTATQFLFAPFTRPFRWSRLFFTYVIPLIPVLIFWDGVVSCLRVYSPEELRALVAELGDTGYSWDIGRVRSVGPAHVTYLIGIPPVPRRETGGSSGR